jgi:putative cell wall-binding protein
MMPRIRSLWVTAAALTIAVAGTAAPAFADYNNPALRGPVHPMTFPVAGKVTYTDTFLAPRSGHLHEGQDLMGAKMTPLVAAVDGVVTTVTIPEPSYGYMLVITGDDGWSYHYLHINNDTPGTDDGIAPLEYVYAPGIAKGARVNAGQLVAYLGDSGNAESAGSHCHFELHDPTGSAVNAYASLQAAVKVTSPAPPAPQDVAAPGGPGDPGFHRLAGSDRVATALSASKAGWPDGSPEMVLASGDRYAEALPASVLAGKLHAPLLLADGNGVSSRLAEEITRLHATRATVIGSVSAAAANGLLERGLTVSRIGTSDPVATAAAIATAVGAGDKTAVLVNKDRFADGISAAALAAGRDWPILLAADRSVPSATLTALRKLGVTRTYVVGGTAVLADGVAAAVPGAERLAGRDRYATSVAALEASLGLGNRSLATTYLSTGANYPDALAAGALAAQTKGLVLLVDGSGTNGDGASREFLGRHPGEVRVQAILGGSRAVTTLAAASLAPLVAPPEASGQP